MEWIMPGNINDMLPDEITKLNYTMIPPGFQGDVRAVRVMQENLSKLIDHLGKQSAQAQGLNKVITTAEKLRNSPTYTLYLLKDSRARCDKGEVIGMLKVGRKHLFMFDENEIVREVEPLCVLDFYVLQDRQRSGHGRRLFDYMLHDMETSAHLLAVDGPSKKMEQFLITNYGMGRLVRQNNNFAVSSQFFENNLDDIRYTRPSSKSGCSTPVVTPSVGRFSAPKPHSAIANVIHGGAQHKEHDGTPSEATVEEEAPAVYELAEPAAAPEPGPAEEPRGLERPCTLQVETPISVQPPAAAPSPAGSCAFRRDSQLTDKGFFDVKFYHNKLW